MMRLTSCLLACFILSVSASVASQPVTVGHFAFYIDEGISLHHYLHQWARRLELDGKIQARLLPDLGLDPHETPAELDETEQRTWTAAINHYRENFTGQNLMFSERNNKLLDRIRAGDLKSVGSNDPDLHVLQSVAAIYHDYWWPKHHAAIEKYLADLVQLIGKHDKCIADGLARAYGAPLPDDQQTRVDLAFVANWAGAYTTGDPVVIHLAASDPDLQGLLGLELMYHEVSHSTWTEPALTELVERAFASIEQKPPRRFWHVVIFNTAGSLTQQCLGRADIEYHQRYAEVAGLATRDGWREIWQVLETHWVPFLAGKSDEREAAMRAAARAFQEGAQK